MTGVNHSATAQRRARELRCRAAITRVEPAKAAASSDPGAGISNAASMLHAAAQAERLPGGRDALGAPLRWGEPGGESKWLAPPPCLALLGECRSPLPVRLPRRLLLWGVLWGARIGDWPETIERPCSPGGRRSAPALRRCRPTRLLCTFTAAGFLDLGVAEGWCGAWWRCDATPAVAFAPTSAKASSASKLPPLPVASGAPPVATSA
jgi:hypothetical protein